MSLTNKGLANKVAQKAGVSLMTVSRVFNDSPRVAAKTRDKVLKAASEFGYEPSNAARALRRGHSNMIGYLVSSPQSLGGTYHGDTIAGIEEVITPHDLILSILIVEDRATLARNIRRYIASGACAALIVRFDLFPKDQLEELAGLEAPIMFASNAPEEIKQNSPYSTVCFDNESGCIQAIRHLAMLKHQKVGFLGGNKGWVDSVQREAGFRKGMAECKLEVNEQWVQHCNFHLGFESGEEVMNQLLSSGTEHPTAVLCASDQVAAGAIQAAKRWGKKIPEDISIIGYDDQFWCRFTTPALSSIRHDGLQLGRSIGEVIVKQVIDQEPLDSKHIVLPTSLVVRESTVAVS
jgi:LacI family transcriptional regulator, galactose operon repressor